MSKTVVGLFSSMSQAAQVKQALVVDGYSSSDIKVVANDDYEDVADGATATANDKDYTDIGSGGGTGIGEKISHFFRSLSGGDEHAHHHYATGVNAGGALLAATVDDDKAAEVAALLKQHGARDIEGGGSAYKAAEPAYSGGSEVAAEGTAIPIIEEELVVGKREVDRGGVRIYSHVVERPVEADVTLRDEQINVERRAVNRPATAADFAAGAGSIIELNATGEEAVVGKTARVVEEVLVGKQSTEHTQAIHDSVRKTQVDVEEVEGETVSKDRY
ncbi:YsnF/AvaK domain-containing protein [Granulicella arctica]|uniref:YsnF/AvaK domain-containing protein n=1 Tax=Granulicella arctica TaxID=940613 RepID=UPI0021E02CEC|nr:YsnF/AvaK domain-containing protein [Granulicella arctica]